MKHVRQGTNSNGRGGAEMGGIVRSGVAAHDAACLAAEVTRQSAVAGSPTQATVDAAEIAYHRSIIQSCKLNNGGNGLEASMRALQDLGQLS
jgi:hypothetical protein